MTDHWLYQIRAEPVLPEALRPEALKLKWYKPLSEPSELLRVEGAKAYHETPLAWHPIEDITVDRWFQNLSVPTPLEDLDVSQIASGAVRGPDPSEFAVAEVFTVDKWFKPLNEPPDEPLRYLATLYDQWAAQEALVFGENSWDNNAQQWDDSINDWDGNEIFEATRVAWFSPLNEPVRPLFDPNSLGINHFFYQAEISLLAPPVAWFQPLHDPPELRDLGLPVAMMPAFIADAQLFKLPWTPEAPLAGVWAAEGAASGAWTPEGPASGTWTEEGPEC